MSVAFSDIKAYVLSQLSTIPNAGQVDGHPGGVLSGEADGALSGFLTVVVRGGTTEEQRTMGGKSSRTYTIEVHVHLPWDEQQPAVCEAAFDARLEAISDLFRDRPSLGGAAHVTDPLQWADSDTHFVTIRGAVLARWKKGILRAMETRPYDGRG